MQKELNNGNSAIGVALTSTVRRLDDAVLTDHLRNRAEAVGLDWCARVAPPRLLVGGERGDLECGGSAASIAATERSSAHYFQRPDRGGQAGGFFNAQYDTLATSLRGYGFYTRLAKDGGNWRWELQANWRSPGFEVNDLAYLDRADYKWMQRQHQPRVDGADELVSEHQLIVGEQRQYTYDGLKRTRSRTHSSRGSFRTTGTAHVLDRKADAR